MRFFLFILANALLYIRPSEFVQELYAVELYRYAIVACLLVSLPVVLVQLTSRVPGVPPVAGCVLGLLPAVVLSNLTHGNAELLLDTSIEYVKVVVYFLLMLALLTWLQRMRQFLYWLTLFTAGLAAIALLRYHADIALPGAVEKAAATNGQFKLNGTFVVDTMRDPETGALIDFKRLCGTGIFNDPNDFALALVCAIPLCFYWMTDPTRRASRPLWLGLALLLGYGVMLTSSRGGFIALMAGLGTLIQSRFGGKKSLLLGLLVLPVMLGLFAGRMTSISTSDGTGQSRIQLWSEALQMFQSSPLFGIGMDNYRTFSRHVAHNSYLHCYTELGLFGGTLFLGAIYFALRGLYAVRPAATPAEPVDPDLARLYPYLLALVVAYSVGILFLSRSYVVPTYMVLGLATVYCRLHGQQLAVPLLTWNRSVLPRLAGLSICFLIGAYTFVRLFAV